LHTGRKDAGGTFPTTDPSGMTHAQTVTIRTRDSRFIIVLSLVPFGISSAAWSGLKLVIRKENRK
jgi:hypothetical protein